MSARYDYSEWDGTQEFADLDPDDLLAGLTDDLLAGGDLDDALRRLLRSGFRNADGEQVPGLRDMLDQLRRRRAEMLAEGDPDGRMAELTRQLDEIEQDERAAIDDLVEEAHNSGDERRSEVTDDVATERRMALDLQPDDPAGRVSSLQHYDFVSSEARERFEELVEELRREMADTFFEGASDALSNMDPEQMQRMRDAYDALNTDARAARARRRPRPELRGVHGAVRRHVPGQPAEPRRAAGAAGRAHGGRPGGVELHEPRAAGPAAQPDGLGARGHGPALAGRAPGPEPPARRARRRLAEVLRLQRRGPHGHEPGHRPGHPAGPARPHGGGAPVGLHAGGPGRDRPGPGAPAHGRGRGPGARPPGQPDQVAGRRRADRAAGRAHRADAPGRAAPGPEGAGRPLRPDQQGPHRRPLGAAHRAPGTTARRRPRPTSTATR